MTYRSSVMINTCLRLLKCSLRQNQDTNDDGEAYWHIYVGRQREYMD